MCLVQYYFVTCTKVRIDYIKFIAQDGEAVTVCRYRNFAALVYSMAETNRYK